MTYRTHVTLKDRHEEYCEASWFNLSGFIQDMMDLLIVPKEELPDDAEPSLPMLPTPLSRTIGSRETARSEQGDMLRLALAAAAEEGNGVNGAPALYSLEEDTVGPLSGRALEELNGSSPLVVVPHGAVPELTEADAETETPALEASATPDESTHPDAPEHTGE